MTQEGNIFYSVEEEEALTAFSFWMAYQPAVVQREYRGALSCLEDVAQDNLVDPAMALDAAHCLERLARQSGNVFAARLYGEVAHDLLPLIFAVDSGTEQPTTRLCPGCPAGWCPGCSPV